MNRSNAVAVCLFMFLICFSLEAWAGPLVWGPKKYVRETGAPVTVTETFAIEKPTGKFYLYIENGGSVRKPGEKPFREPVNQASSAYIKLNGIEVVSPQDLNQNVYNISKDITLQANNTIEVEVRGKPESYITVEIRKTNLNETVSNEAVDLSGGNMKDQVHLTWGYAEGAIDYVIYKAYSVDGPWIKLGNVPLTNAVDITPEAQTKDLCYKIEALDSKGKVIRVYEPICVPKWQKEESALPLTMGSLSNIDVELATVSSTSSSTASSSQPYNAMCLSDSEFIDKTSMSYEDIKKLLKDKGSFLQGDEVKDVDGSFFDPAEFIDFAAQVYGINPRVILATLEKEQQAITTKKLPDKSVLKHIMGYGKPSTITDQILDGTAQMRRDFDRLSDGQSTAGGWKVGVAKLSGEPNPGDEKDASGKSISVTPANKAVAVLFTYTPWVGQDWGGQALIGGNALFCNVWKKFGFVKCKPEDVLTITGSDTTIRNSTKQYTATGCPSNVAWSVSGTGATISSTGLLTAGSTACGSLAVTATCVACGTSATQTVRVTDSGQWQAYSYCDVRPCSLYGKCQEYCSRIQDGEVWGEIKIYVTANAECEPLSCQGSPPFCESLGMTGRPPCFALGWLDKSCKDFGFPKYCYSIQHVKSRWVCN